MHDVYLIVYAKSDTEIIYRLVKTGILYENHSSNGMGWYIVDIQRYYKGRFLPLEEVKKNIQLDIEKRQKKDKILKSKNKFKRNLKFHLRKLINKI